MGNGSTEIIHLFAESNIRENGKVIIPQPTFAEYEAATRRFGGQPKFVVATSDSLSLPIEQILKKTSPETQAVFICNPNNPTGELIKKNKILEVVEKAERKNIQVLVDETFIEFSEEYETLIYLASKFHNLMVVRSFTKIFALTGLRIGFGVGHRSMIEEIMRRKVPWNINCLAEAAVLASLDDKDYIRKSKITIQREKEYLQEQLYEIPGLTPFPTQTNFLLISTERTGRTSHEIQTSLLRRGVIVRDCSSFRGLGDFFIRVAIRQREQNEKLIKALSETLK
jgi:threonine-phosphate decarboxylase